jgi:hypothetical protein
MNFIYNIYGFVKDKLLSLYSKQEINTQDNDDHYNDYHYDYHYFFINTANIYNASELMINELPAYINRNIKIYLLKSHKLEPLFKNDYIVVTDKNIKKINHKLTHHRRHLHTFVDAIDSFIEYNKNIKNYSIYY